MNKNLRHIRSINKGIWRAFLHKATVCVLDTETTGLDHEKNVMLSFSYSLIEKGKSTKKRTFYFDYPDDLERVNPTAIQVNGLTPERLCELGITPYDTAAKEIMNDLRKSSLIVGHNVLFDLRFLKSSLKENNIAAKIKQIKFFDTCEKTAHIPNATYGRKRPKLSELAHFLEVKTDPDHLHASEYDVQITEECFLKLAKDGLVNCSPTGYFYLR